jgi:acyl-coenzyme A synthetase/AMP-(fatty) acid ligase
VTTTLQDGNVAMLLEAAAMRRGAAAAIVAPDGRVVWSFDGLAEAAARTAGGLHGLGVGAGDRVLVLESDQGRRIKLAVAVLWAGAAVVVPPASLSPWDALVAAGGSAPRAVVFGPLLWPAVIGRSGLRRVPLRIATGGPRPPGAVALADLERCGPVEPAAVRQDAPALVSFTTGSSGPPTPVIRSHGVLRAQHDALRALRALSDADRDFVGLPNLVLHNLGSGVTSVLSPGRPAARDFGSRVLQALAETRATSAAGFPHLLASAAASGRPGLLDRIRAIHVGGTRVAPVLVEALGRLAPAAAVTVVYGSTQVEPIATIGAGEFVDALAGSDPSAGVCAGHVVAGLEVRIEPTRAGRVETTPAPAGAILARGPRVAGVPPADGWSATGDAGWLDGAGRLWLLGRTDNALDDVYPFAVERAVEALDWVRRAALVRVGATRAPRGVLAIEPLAWGDPATREARVVAIRRLLAARAWRIEDVILVREMPVSRGPAAKVDVERLRRRRPGR